MVAAIAAIAAIAARWRQKYQSPVLARESAESPCSARRRVSVGFGVRVRDDDGDRRAAGRVAERGPGRDELDKQTAPLAPLAPLGPVTFFIFLKEHRAEPIIPPKQEPWLAAFSHGPSALDVREKSHGSSLSNAIAVVRLSIPNPRQSGCGFPKQWHTFRA